MQAKLLPAVLIAGAHLLFGCAESDRPDDKVADMSFPEPAQEAPASDAVAGAELSKLDPATMHDAEISRVLGNTAFCTFHYTSSGKPILAAGSEVGVVKINGKLIRMDPATIDGELVVSAEPVQMRISLKDGPDAVKAPEEYKEAEGVFTVGNELKVGYAGYYRCRDPK